MFCAIPNSGLHRLQFVRSTTAQCIRPQNICVASQVRLVPKIVIQLYKHQLVAVFTTEVQKKFQLIKFEPVKLCIQSNLPPKATPLFEIVMFPLTSALNTLESVLII
jgi:hypothetical protein